MRNLSNQAIARYENTAEDINAATKEAEPVLAAPVSNIPINSTKPDRAIAGIPNKKENRAAVARSKLLNKPAVMVDPERDTPGMMAKV